MTIPTLMFYFESHNENQKYFCLKVRDNFKYDYSVKYEIKSTLEDTFLIQVEIGDDIYDITNEFDDSEEKMNEILDKIYEVLDEKYKLNTLIANIENEEQEEFCMKLKENFTYKESIKYKFGMNPASPFSIKLKIKDNIYDIASEFDDSEEKMNEILDKAYDLLDKN